MTKKYPPLQRDINRRKYLRRKLMWPSHLTRTGHRYKAEKDKDGNRTGRCSICGEKQVVRAHNYKDGVVK